MPAKNVSSYVSEAINGLLMAHYDDWELIVIEDHSTDDTLSILREMEEQDSRIRVFENKGIGKVAALNYGYTFSSGVFIKCIDADDVLSERFFDYIYMMNDCDALCHNSYVTASDLTILGSYSVDKSILIKDFSYCLKNLKSLPRWTWSFTRSIGDRIFPMPTELPFEDVWFSLMIKKYAKRICHINDKLYYYRQHDNQAYGGVLNFSEQIVNFRARRMLKLIDVIKEEKTRQLMSGISDADFFDGIKNFYGLLARQTLNFIDIFKYEMPLEFRLKLIIYKKLSFLAPLIIRLKWFLDNKQKVITTPPKNLVINSESCSKGCVETDIR
jgi:glycosyltransferase involved in cell wall biosynthesis